MGLVGHRAEVRVDVRDQIIDEKLLEAADVEAAATAGTARAASRDAGSHICGTRARASATAPGPCRDRERRWFP